MFGTRASAQLESQTLRGTWSGDAISRPASRATCTKASINWPLRVVFSPLGR